LVDVKAIACRWNHSWIPEELQQFVEGRGRQERKDSVNLQILNERKHQHERMQEKKPSEDLVKHLESEGFGKKQRISGVYSTASGTIAMDTSNGAKTSTGAGKGKTNQYHLELLFESYRMLNDVIL